jgi:hypothetical protein
MNFEEWAEKNLRPHEGYTAEEKELGNLLQTKMLGAFNDGIEIYEKQLADAYAEDPNLPALPITASISAFMTALGVAHSAGLISEDAYMWIQGSSALLARGYLERVQMEQAFFGGEQSDSESD